MKTLILLLFPALLCLVSAHGQRKPLTTTEMAVAIATASREVVYCNRTGSMYVTESSAPSTGPTQGWSVLGRKILQDYTIRIGDDELDRRKALSTTVAPNEIVRRYPSGVVETVTLFDNANILVVLLDSIQGKTVTARPFLSNARDTTSVVTLMKFGEMIIGRTDHAEATSGDHSPGWVGMLLTPATSFSFIFHEPTRTALGYSPASLVSATKSNQYAVLFVATPDVRTIYNLGASNIRTFLDSLYDRRVRLDQLMRRGYFRTDDEEMNRAFHWARIGLDGLYTVEPVPGIRSGVPADAVLDAREAFRSLSGAFVFPGEFKKARDILRAFGAAQDTAEGSATFGKIPDQLRTLPLTYRSADATALFVDALASYVDHSGDTGLARELFPAVRRSIAGATARTDNHGLLLHSPGATWMGVGRGDKAIEVEAFWYRQLTGAARLAAIVGAREEAERWTTNASAVRGNFAPLFLDSSRAQLYDAVGSDGSRVLKTRPNQIFGIDLLEPQEMRNALLAEFTRSLVYPFGVGTLVSVDGDFKPWSDAPGSYTPEAGAVDGVVASWLDAEWIVRAAQSGAADSAYLLTTSLADRMLREGTVGCIPQTIDVLPREGATDRAAGGRRLDASSLAGFVRSWYEGYLGVRVDSAGRRLTLRPSLPSSLHDVDFNINVGGVIAAVRYRWSQTAHEVTVSTDSAARAFTLRCELSLPESPASGPIALACADMIVQGGRPRTLRASTEGIVELSGGKTTDVSGSKLTVPRLGSLRFAAVPPAAPAARRSADIQLLTRTELGKVPAPTAITIALTDPAGDDTGAVHTPYPPGVSTPEGSSDLTGASISFDNAVARFTLTLRNLPYPNHFPASGIEGVIAAIAVERAPRPKRGSTSVGRNAAATIENFSADRTIYVGNGVRIEDAGGNVLAEYFPSPSDERDPIGNYNAGSISFSLPLALVGPLTAKSRIAVLAGPRDDAGGGIGEFATLSALGSTKKTKNANVLDMILPAKRK